LPLAPKGRSIQAQANGLGLGSRRDVPGALKGRDKTVVTAIALGRLLRALGLRLGLAQAVGLGFGGSALRACLETLPRCHGLPKKS
jgi:hypothetical protein